jgi:hypothetical protein
MVQDSELSHGTDPPGKDRRTTTMSDMTHDQPTHELGVMDGNPFHDALFEQPQQRDLDCAEASVADVINETGHGPVTDEDIANEAQNDSSSVHPGPIYDPAKGTVLADAPALLAAHGVQAVYADDQTAAQGGPATNMDALQQQLSTGHHVLVGVDGEKIWDAIGVPHSHPDSNDPDHVVEVTGVDTDKGVVYLNDTGNADPSSPVSGAGEAVDIKVFENAWASADHAMVATTDADPAAVTLAPHAVPGPICPAPHVDPFAPITDHPAETAAVVAGIGVAAVGASALATKESRAAAMANVTAMINRARGAAGRLGGGSPGPSPAAG